MVFCSPIAYHDKTHDTDGWDLTGGFQLNASQPMRYKVDDPSQPLLQFEFRTFSADLEHVCIHKPKLKVNAFDWRKNEIH